MEIIAVIVNENNIVSNSFAYAEVERAQKMFKILINDMDNNITEEQIEDLLDDGYYEHPTLNKTVCLTHFYVRLDADA